MAEKKNAFCCGTPSLEEWSGEWRSSASDSEVSESEYDEVWSEFERRLERLGNARRGPDQEFYFRGDNYGDRTQYLEVRKPKSLTVNLLETLQLWLREPRFRQWRILVVTYLGEEGGIVVYPHAIRVGRGLGNDVTDAIRRIVLAMCNG